MNAQLRLALVLACVGAVALGGLACEAHKGEAEAPDEKVAVSPEEPFASPPPRDLATLQRELAMQESELRRLGVLAEPEPEAAMQLEEEQAEASPDEKPADVPSGRADKGKKDGKKAENKTETKMTPAKAKDASGGVPGAAPRPAADDGDAAAAEPGRTAVDEREDSIEGTPAPEAAKSVQAPPRDQPNQQQQLRAEERCPLICSLAENTCELAEEICTLAEQHGDDSEYSVACERASDDCKQAREACLECHG